MKLKLLGLVFALLFLGAFPCSVRGQEIPANLRRSGEEILGTISPNETNFCVVKRFFDPYPSFADAQRKEYRWRIRVPNGEAFNVAWTTGELPAEGFPISKNRLIPKRSRLPAAVGDVVIVVRAEGGDKPSLEINLFGEFPQPLPFSIEEPNGEKVQVTPNRLNATTYQGTFIKDATWLPYWKANELKVEDMDHQKETSFAPAGNHWLMKHVIEQDGKQIGYGIWLEFKE